MGLAYKGVGSFKTGSEEVNEVRAVMLGRKRDVLMGFERNKRWTCWT